LEMHSDELLTSIELTVKHWPLDAEWPEDIGKAKVSAEDCCGRQYYNQICHLDKRLLKTEYELFLEQDYGRLKRLQMDSTFGK